MTKRIPVDQVDLIYRDHVAAGVLRDPGLLDGAVAAPFQHVFDTEVHATIVQKAVKLLDGISRAQAYSDGNKRLAWLTMVSFLEINGLMIVPDVTQEEAAAFVLTLRGDQAGLREAAEWLSERLSSLT